VKHKSLFIQVCVLCLALVVLGIFSFVPTEAVETGKNKMNDTNIEIAEVIGWLPEDTETVTVTQVNTVLTSDRATNRAALGFAQYLAIIGGMLPCHQWSAGAKLSRVITGARNFRKPSGNGPFLFDGCSILDFASDSPISAKQFTELARQNCSENQMICEFETFMFRQKVGNDIWAFYACSLAPNIVIWATNKSYLDTFLERQSRKESHSTLLSDSALWQSVDRSATFWAVRDYSRMPKGKEYPSPDLLLSKDGHEHRDISPIGFTAAYRDSDGSLISTYLSNDRKAQEIRAYWEQHSDSFDLVPAIVTHPLPGVLRIAQDTTQGSNEARFALRLIILGALGHGEVI
jgi:hypothetical protein